MRLEDLPALPSAVTRLLEPGVEGETGPEFLREVVEADAALSSRILRALRTPAFRFEAQVSSIPRAIALLKGDDFREVAISLAVHGGLVEGSGARRIDRQLFWLHTVAVAAAAREIARETRRAAPFEAYGAGLLHDVGKLLLDRRDAPRYEAYLRAVESGEEDLLAGEASLLGTDHARFGGEACGLWGLPGPIREAVAGHHPSPPAPPGPLASIIHVADFLAWSGGLGSLALRRHPVLDPAAAGHVRYEALDKARIRAAIDREVSRAAKILGLSVPDPDRIREALEDTNVELSRVQDRFRETQRLLERRSVEIAAVAEAIAKARQASDTNLVVRQLLGAIHKGLGFDRVYLFLPDVDRRILRGRLVAGGEARPVDPSRLEVPIDPATAPSFVTFTRAACGHGPLRLGRRERAEGDWLAALGVDEMGLAPVQVEGTVLGVIAVDQVVSRLPLEDARLESLMVLAQETGLVIEKARLLQKNQELAIDDELTEVANRKRWRNTVDQEFERARRYGRPLSIVLVDIDAFGSFNQAHGTNAGDDVLRHLGRLLDQLSRQTDLVGRHGGEEFAIVLPETSSADALLFGERVRRAFESYAAKLATRFPGAPLTVSIGVAGWSNAVATSEDLVKRAEAALARAKAEGRNRVALEG